ncbi:hypothetical protein [Microbacterium sp. K22]|nr:hypothetical protein [Microbacterium sp. K22]
MAPDSYTNSLRTRLRVLFSPVRLTLYIAAITFSVVANVIYLRDGTGTEWLGPASVVPLLALVAWQFATDKKMRRLDRESADRDS